MRTFPISKFRTPKFRIPKFVDHISPLLLAAVVAGGFVVTSALPATAEGRDERRDRLHSERPIAAATALQSAGLKALAEQAEWDGAVFAAVAAFEGELQAAAAAEAEAARAAQATYRAPARSSGCNGDAECFLACTRAHESDSAGGYGAVSSSGAYRGAYQFNQGTWAAAAAGAGFEEYSGGPADEAPAAVQDAAAAHLYGQSGNQAWGGRC